MTPETHTILRLCLRVLSQPCGNLLSHWREPDWTEMLDTAVIGDQRIDLDDLRQALQQLVIGSDQAAIEAIRMCGHPGAFEAAEALTYIVTSDNPQRTLFALSEDEGGRLLSQEAAEHAEVARDAWIVGPMCESTHQWSVHFFPSETVDFEVVEPVADHIARQVHCSQWNWDIAFDRHGAVINGIELCSRLADSGYGLAEWAGQPDRQIGDTFTLYNEFDGVWITDFNLGEQS